MLTGPGEFVGLLGGYSRGGSEYQICNPLFLSSSKLANLFIGLRLVAWELVFDVFFLLSMVTLQRFFCVSNKKKFGDRSFQLILKK